MKAITSVKCGDVRTAFRQNGLKINKMNDYQIKWNNT
jgi:hypothetical protein